VGEVEGEGGLAQLLEHRAVALRRQGVLDELLGDRRRALGGPAGGVGDNRAGDAADVDAGVRPEALVLDRHDCPPHVGANLVERVDDVVVGRSEDADRPPHVVIEIGVLLVLVLLAVLQLR
jgi:hypothetical protein